MRVFGSHHFTSAGLTVRKYATTVYKGISATNKQYEDGLKGIVYPTPTNGQAMNNSQDSLQRLDAASSHNWGKYVSYFLLLRLLVVPPNMAGAVGRARPLSRACTPIPEAMAASCSLRRYDSIDTTGESALAMFTCRLALSLALDACGRLTSFLSRRCWSKALSATPL